MRVNQAFYFSVENNVFIRVKTLQATQETLLAERNTKTGKLDPQMRSFGLLGWNMYPPPLVIKIYRQWMKVYVGDVMSKQPIKRWRAVRKYSNWHCDEHTGLPNTWTWHEWRNCFRKPTSCLKCRRNRNDEEEEIAVHWWMQMQETKFYRDESFTLVARWGENAFVIVECVEK